MQLLTRLLNALLCVQAVAGYKLVIDSNTMTVADLQNASTGILRADGSYSIFVNTVPQATDAEWRAYMDAVGPANAKGSTPGLFFTEENPDTYDSCKMFARIKGEPPTASLGYEETGIIAGGTLITGEQIDKQAKECNAPVLVLTRAFFKTASNKLEPGDDPAWIVNTTRALAHPNVYGVAMEFTPGWPMSGQGCGLIDLIQLAISQNKTMVMLLPVYLNFKDQQAWQNIQDLVEGLFDGGAPMHDDRVVLSLARYDQKAPRGPVPWWGEDGNTVQHAYDWIQAHRNNASMMV